MTAFCFVLFLAEIALLTSSNLGSNQCQLVFCILRFVMVWFGLGEHSVPKNGMLPFL